MATGTEHTRDMVRVCMVSAEYAPNVHGGLGWQVTDLAQALAARDVERHYTWERVAARTAELYREVTGRCKDMPAF